MNQFSYNISGNYKSAHLLGPLQGPEWLLNNADLPHLPPITGSNSVEGTFLWAVSLFGSIENGATVITVLSSTRCRRPLHILVGCLAMTDLFISTIYIPSYTYFLLEGVPNINTTNNHVAQIQKAEVEYEWNVCVITRTFFIQIASVTLTIKALISGYLYIYTTSKQTAERMFTVTNTIIFILIACLLNLLLLLIEVLFVPNMIGYKQIGFYPNAILCQPNWHLSPKPLRELELPSFLYLSITLALHIIELSIMCACFIRVHYAIRVGRSIWVKKSRDVDFLDRPNAAIYSRAMRTTVLLFLTFGVCWVPIYVANIIDPLHVRFPSYIHHIVMDLLLLKSAINPAIYIYGIRSLRRELKLMCLCRCRDPNARNINFRAPISSSLETIATGQSNDAEIITA